MKLTIWLLAMALLSACACGGGGNGSGGSTDAGADSGTNEDANPAIGRVVAVVTLHDLAGEDRTRVPTTFGHLFAPGSVPDGYHLTGRGPAGEAFELQTDVKARHADGSLRHAVFSLVLPSLSASADLQLELVVAERELAGSPLTATALFSDGFEAGFEVSLSGKIYRAELMASLDGAQLWLQGPVVSEWLVAVPLVADGETPPHPHLNARFAIRAYAGLGSVRVSAALENSWAFEPDPKVLTYDATLSIDGVAVSTHLQIAHYRQARWREVVWRGAPSALHVSFDAQALVSTGAVPSYDLSTAVEASALDDGVQLLAESDTGPMGLALLDPYMPGTGARPDIGPFTTWAARDLISQDARARAVTLATGEAAASWSVHYRDKQTGLPVLLTDYPAMTIVGNPGDAKNPDTGVSEAFPSCATECATPYRHDTAHQASMAYLPYLYTGDHYLLEELQFWSAYNVMQSNPGYREYGKGLLKAEQVRGQAWALRTLGFTAYITPDGDPLKNYFLDRLRDNLAWYNSTYSQAADANALGVLTEKYVDFAAMAGWMDDFFTWSVGQLVAMGFEDARPIFEWKSKFPVGRIVGEGFCWIMGAPYHLIVAPTNNASEIYTSFADVYRANAQQDCDGTPLHALPCGGAAMASCLGRAEGEMGGYPTSPAGYPSNLQPALAISAELGAADAMRAWNLFAARPVRPDYSSSPQYNVVPRNP